jgi:hypothetical protein
MKHLFIWMATALTTALLGPHSAKAADPKGQLTWSTAFSIAPTWFDPAETTGGDNRDHHPLRVSLCPPRRCGEADAGRADGAKPLQVVVRIGRRPHL